MVERDQSYVVALTFRPNQYGEHRRGKLELLGTSHWHVKEHLNTKAKVVNFFFILNPNLVPFP